MAPDTASCPTDRSPTPPRLVEARALVNASPQIDASDLPCGSVSIEAAEFLAGRQPLEIQNIALNFKKHMESKIFHILCASQEFICCTTILDRA